MTTKSQIGIEIVDEQTRDEAADAQHSSRHPIHTARYRVGVPIGLDQLETESDRQRVSRLVQLAVDIATDQDGAVLLIGVKTALPPETVIDGTTVREPLPEWLESARETMADLCTRAAAATDVPLGGVIALGRAPAQTVLQTLPKHDCSAVVLAHDSQSDGGGRLPRRTVDEIRQATNCSIFTDTVGSDWQCVGETTESSLPAVDIDEILLAVAYGPNTILAAETARAIAVASDARLDIRHFVTSENEQADHEYGDELLDLIEYIVSSVDEVTTQVTTVTSIPNEIVDRSSEYDLVVLGASKRREGLNRFLDRSVDRPVREQSHSPVLTVEQRSDSSLSLYYRWKRLVDDASD